jgi:two-component system sensor histidine kinase KdpD
VHVSSQDGLRDGTPGALADQRSLVEQLGGSYHQVVGDDIPQALVDFARASNATQLVIGVSRRSRLTALLTGPGIGATVIRESGDIDVHIVSHAAAAGAALPRFTGGLTARRRIYGFVLAIVGVPLLTWALVALRSTESMTADVLSYQLLVVLVAMVGGLWPALFAALVSGVTLDFFFVEPLYSVTIGEPYHLYALVLFLLIAALVSLVVDRAARRSRAAKRAGAEAELLATVAGGVIRGEDALQALVTRTRESFGLTGVRLMVGEEALYSDGQSTDPAHTQSIPVGDRGTLELSGRDLPAADRRLLAVIVSQLDAALEHRELSATASELAPLAEADRVRSALLAAVGHDLRRPLAAATAAVTSLRSTDVAWSPTDQDELLETAEVSLHSLADLVTNLLDVSRLEAGVLAVSLASTDLDDLIPPVLDELDLGPGDVELDLPAALPPVIADAVLLQRVFVNLLTNAIRFSPPGSRPVIAASEFGGRVDVRIVDHGPGVSDDRRDAIFVPFQRLGDTDNTTGVGLGLALSKGFVEGMGGIIEAEDTPGGGLTMVVSLPIDDRGETR